GQAAADVTGLREIQRVSWPVKSVFSCPVPEPSQTERKSCNKHAETKTYNGKIKIRRLPRTVISSLNGKSLT
ncbi:hypothetical protein, partial [Klebsiella variicola]|uniref:hypothetical protein n=1 Tax=Klebsiella variicola TaxID=244366 RepID=UPI0019554D51